MYIEPLALFIIAEVVLVIIIISAFLFYRSRLLRVLLALLTEMRMNRARREVRKKQELAELRNQNAKLHKENDTYRDEGQQTYAEQLQSRLHELEEPSSTETDESGPEQAEEDETDGHRTRAILRAFYQFETARADPDQYDLKTAEDDLLEQLKIQLGRDPDEEESESVQSQSAHLLERVKKLEPLQGKLEAAESENSALRSQLGQEQERIQELEKINTTAEMPPGDERLNRKTETDEIYRLKCERFDMAESINALKLKLQKMVGDGDANDLLEIQEEQIRQQEKYIRDADASIALLEKELEQTNQQQSGEPDAGALERAQEQHDQLAVYAEAQKSSMQAIRDNLVAMRKAEKAEELEALMSEQEARLGAMERAVQESDTCVAMMESELETANQVVASLQSQLDEQPTPDNELQNKAEKYRHQADEMENVLRKLMQDSEDMVSCIKELEAENQSLRSPVEATS